MNIITIGSALGASFFLTTPRFVWGAISLVVLIIIGVKYIQSLWVKSEPNQWLLVIQNGKMVRSGIGLKCIVWPMQTVVKFPSAIQRVEFSANNVTKEMQGVEVSGFAIWSVNREGDGPFKSYKYTQDGNANQNVCTMCESIVRNKIANHSMQEILTDRNILRDEMRADLQKQLTGWGIWLETIEITEVKVCSRTLFEDMQAEFRQEAHLKAENIRLTTSNQISTRQMESDLAMNKSRQDNETSRVTHENKQKIKRQQEEMEYFKKECEIQSLKIVEAQQLEMKKMQVNNETEKKKLSDRLEIEKINNDFMLQKFADQLKIEKNMDPLTMQKYMIDATKQIYQDLPLKEIKLNQYIGPEQTSNIASMLPAMGMMMQQNQMVAQK
uniref:SPFH domain/Band 7 family protein n=1 Tax=Trepomonas sp. PC1 TaxID=1076344 RepID=A0A146KAA7_9EUKA|eukprot:JAP92329.1 SPFH domain/Band 7 family protein [Trepomonas sp. PC1]